jgi:hypothetical protein
MTLSLPVNEGAGLEADGTAGQETGGTTGRELRD